MNDLKDRSNKNAYFENFLRKASDLPSISQIKKHIPKVNFKKIKLFQYQDIDRSLKTKNITKVYLDNILEQADFPAKRHIEKKDLETSSTNPLRKKNSQGEDELKVHKLETSNPPAEIKKQEEVVTFNLEAHVNHDEEDVIFSPSTVTIPPLIEDSLSTSSGSAKNIIEESIEQKSQFIWPPPTSIKRTYGKKKRKKEKSKQKNKPYFLQSSQSQAEFPWVKAQEDYQSIENIFKGGLESELIDTPVEKVPSRNPEIQERKPEQITYKAVQSQAFLDQDIKNVELDTILESGNKVNFDTGTLGKVKEMFYKLGNLKITPIKIAVIGGTTACISYLLWNYFIPNVTVPRSNKDYISRSQIFKQKHIPKTKEETPQETINKTFKPITEKERLALIAMAREALGGRADPFGQESFLPFLSNKSGLTATGEKEVPTVPAQRKQIELLGVVSTKDKTLALVNVYTANYAVELEDDSDSIEKKLKDALGMAEANRIEVSVLDPVDDWSVRAIQKSKSRSDDPTIELVKGDKKFNLRVGQRVLLPETKSLEEIKAELEKSQYPEDLVEESKVKEKL